MLRAPGAGVCRVGVAVGHPTSNCLLSELNPLAHVLVLVRTSQLYVPAGSTGPVHPVAVGPAEQATVAETVVDE